MSFSINPSVITGIVRGIMSVIESLLSALLVSFCLDQTLALGSDVQIRREIRDVSFLVVMQQDECFLQCKRLYL